MCLKMSLGLVKNTQFYHHIFFDKEPQGFNSNKHDTTRYF